MGFLDNSGDIILDAVLTDTGRFRLAKGDGSFKISKFALGDDEIDYQQYDKNNASGSAYYDLTIMQTPIFEALTNNASSMQSMLMSMGRNNLLYLPVIKLYEQISQYQRYTKTGGAINTFLVAVDADTENKITNVFTDIPDGILLGQSLKANTSIMFEQGLDTIEIPSTVALDPDLVETQYIIEMDNRFGKIASNTTARSIANPSFIDDDNIASYYFSATQNSDYVQTSGPWKVDTQNPTQPANYKGIRGPRGSRLNYLIASSIDLATSTYLFDTLGQEGFYLEGDATNEFLFIDSTVRVIGGTTGYNVDLPIRYIKLKQ